ncbi:hypothetical protein [Micromonospora rosaria]|uniref:hypothetical protein n=1 Tax=Micromonospora rosaria TaxID=47874 RepID=UPI000836E57F|nr:hypothetical protein [Micromonospora rosaria]
MSIRPGDVFLLTRAASVQFARPITVRVIHHHADRPTYHGWTWIDCYQLDARGDAVARRELYVMPAGMVRQTDPPAASGRVAVRRATAQQVPRRAGGNTPTRRRAARAEP